MNAEWEAQQWSTQVKHKQQQKKNWIINYKLVFLICKIKEKKKRKIPLKQMVLFSDDICWLTLAKVIDIVYFIISNIFFFPGWVFSVMKIGWHISVVWSKIL